jgi:hypothetical protein
MGRNYPRLRRLAVQRKSARKRNKARAAAPVARGRGKPG